MDSIVEDAVNDLEDDSENAVDELSDDVPAPGVSQGAKQSVGGTDTSNVGMSDDELANVLDDLQTNITVFGCGGAGNNTLARMFTAGIEGADYVAVNTDVQDLVDIEIGEGNKILIGKDIAQGRGAGDNPEVGEAAAENDLKDINAAVEDSDMVFVTAGMGGGTGTGAAPVVAEAAKDAGALTIAIVTTPFESEGKTRMENAHYGLTRLREHADTVIVVPNERLTDEYGDRPIRQAFRIADNVLMHSVKGITELITKPGLVNLDFADVTTVMENGGVAMIGLGEAEGGKKARDAVKSALDSPLLDVDISGADSVIVNVTGGDDMSIKEAEGVAKRLDEQVSEDARLIWGASIDEDLDGKIRTMVAVTGVRSPQMYSSSSAQKFEVAGVDNADDADDDDDNDDIIVA